MEGGGTPYSSSMAPSGSYILIVVSQPVTEDHKKLILDRLNKGLLSWDVDSTGCDLSGLETVCADITAKHLNDTDVLIQHSTESLGVEVLVSPTVSTLKQCVKNLLSTSTGHKQLIHAGYTFAGSGSWLLQNGAFSCEEFLDLYHAAGSSRGVHLHCAALGGWTALPQSVLLNPPAAVACVPGAQHLRECLERVLSPQALEDIMESSALVGNIRFNRPTLYLFPAGQGDCALFGINGFNMLVDGGFNRKPCAWEFVRHLDRLDAVLVTRLCENNVCGVSTLMKRKSLNNTYPQIGYVFCNIATDGGVSSPTPKADAADDELVVSVVKEGHAFTDTLNELKLKPHNCWRDSSVDPFVLYHKVGHGTLEMHVLSPPKDSKEMKDFLTEWGSYKETFSSIKSGLKSKSLEGSIPLSHATSICAVLVWRPADPKDTITRILFPGSAPQSKIFESLEKLKALDVLKQPVVTKESLSVVTKSVTKTVGKTVPSRKNTASPALSVSSAASRNGDVKKEVVAKKVVKEVIKKDNKDLVKREGTAKKEVAKKEVTAKKIESAVKKEAPKKDLTKEPKKEAAAKKIVKKETATKEVKPAAEKKAAPKKADTPVSKTVSEVKKATTTTVRKSTTPVKKDVVSKPAAKPAVKSTPPKASEPKTAKDVSNKKAAEAKSVPKTKPKTPAKTSTNPKTKTSSAKSTPSSMTKAVAASSIVASAVAVTAAAFELNEKKEEIIAEPSENKEVAEEPEAIPEPPKEEEVAVEKPEEIQEPQMPPEALSPTPSESVSLTPSDTLSSAPLETVSPTPPLGNEPMSMEEKEVNEIKEIDQDLEEEEAAEVVPEEQAAEEEEDDIERELARRQKNDDMMSMSFVGMQNEGEEPPVEEQVVCKSEAAPQQLAAAPAEELPDDEDKEVDSAEKVDEEEGAEKNEYDDVVEEEKDIDDQLAHMSMEGSFCAGRPYDQEILAQVEELKSQQQEEEQYDEEDVQEKSDLVAEKEEGSNKELYEQEQNNQMSQSFIAENGRDVDDDDYENKEVLDVEEDQIQPTHVTHTTAAAAAFDDNQFHHQDKFDSEELEKEVEEEKEVDKDTFCEETYDNNKFDNRYDDDYRNIIADSDMQETSVDEPEEIVRKESSVSITLNDEGVAGDYDDHMRRKSCTESEDDVDIQRYMSTTAGDGDSLGVGGRDSDEEDVVKSPTPHAVVDFDDRSPQQEKQDLDDEKERDSAEDDDDGEMVRHPTPPYSEEEMRDPIGPHFITTPGLQQVVGGITEEPLYEENEDAGSERSISPVVEQPVFGNTAQADFPELVTVSGGTTPSEPQSPKSGFGAGGKFGTEAAAVMDALSEHDCSEGSAHSPLVHDEANAFEMPVEEKQQDENLEKYSRDESERVIQSESEVPRLGDAEAHESEEMFHKESAQSFESQNEQKDSAESYESQICKDEITESYESQTDHKEIAQSYESEYEEKEVAQPFETQYEQKEVAQSFESQYEEKEVAQPYETQYEQEVAESYESQYEQNEVSQPFETQCKQEVAQPFESQYEQKEIAESFESQLIQKEVVESYSSHMEQGEATESYESQMKDEFHESPVLQTLQDESENIQKMNAESQESEIPHQSLDQQPPMTTETTIEKHSFDNESEDESYSQNDQSETRSERSDIHKDDKSDHQQDGNDDQFERRSDIHDDDRSDSHYDDKQDDYDSKGADSYDMHEGTRSHAEHAIDNDYCETNQQETVVQGGGDSFDRQSLTEETSPNYQQGDEFDTNSASVSEISQIKTEAYEQHSESIVKDNGAYEESGASKLPTSEVPSDFAPSKNEGHGFVTDPYSVSQSALDQFGSSPAHHGSEDFKEESSSQNDFSDPLSKYEGQTEYRAYKADMDEEVRMVQQQSESEVTSKYDEYNDFRSEMLQDNSHQQSYNLSHSDDVSPQGVSSYENKTLTEMTEAHQYETLSKFEENVHTSTAAYSESTSNVVSYEEEDPNFNYSSNDLMRPPATQQDPRDVDSHSEEQQHYGVVPDSTYRSDVTETKEAYHHHQEYSTDDHREDPAFGGLTNGKGWTHESESTTVTGGYTNAETSYIINSRFHSDSPEDNIMRSDSSPDVPPYPLDASGQISDLKHFEQSEVDYSNMNALPPSPVKALHTNRDNYPSSDEDEEEDEDSSSLPGTVSPYAYTNKAYAKEEEDIDGNHIYNKESVIEKTTGGFDDNQFSTQQQVIHQETGQANYDFRLEEWDKPLGLPTPPETGTKVAKKAAAPKTANGTAKLSPLKKPKSSKEPSSSPVYLDLAYVPHHGDPHYCDVEFFKKIRARYYVFSGINPSKEVLNALLEAKKSWKEDLEVTIIPTYETDALGYWMAQNQDDLAEYSIEVAPSASRCTVNLQDHATSCAAYRLEF